MNRFRIAVLIVVFAVCALPRLLGEVQPPPLHPLRPLPPLAQPIHDRQHHRNKSPLTRSRLTSTKKPMTAAASIFA